MNNVIVKGGVFENRYADLHLSYDLYTIWRITNKGKISLVRKNLTKEDVEIEKRKLRNCIDEENYYKERRDDVI